MQDLKIAAIQMTSAVGDIEGNLTSIDRLLGDAVRQGADIACFPELCVSGYNTVFAAICNQVRDNDAGHTFSGVTFVCDPTGKLMAQANDGANEEIVLADLEAVSLEKARHVPETFFRHFRRPEIYDAWRSN